MVAPMNPISEIMRGKVDEAQRYVNRLVELENEGIITPRVKKYAEQLIILNFLGDEAEVFAKHGIHNRAMGSLTEMRGGLDGVAGVLMTNDETKIKNIGGGLLLIEDMCMENVGKYKPLYDVARGVYDAAVEKVKSIMEEAA